VFALGQDLRGRAGFHDLALVHHRDAVGHAGDDGEVMGDEQEGHVFLGHEVFQEVEDLCLGGDVERGGWLIRDQETGWSAMAAAMQTRCRWPPESSCG
jgi:hypothetical protein